MRYRRLRALLPAVAAAASLAGCDSGGPPAALGGERPPPNAADVTFVRSMAADDKGALAITRLGRHRAHRLELRRIARKMTTEQVGDIAALLRWGGGGLASRALRPSSSAAADLARVRHAVSFDYEFMRTMIEQSQAAIVVARREVVFGRDAELRRLAGAIASSRQKELDQLRAWLHLWYGDVQPAPGGPGGAPRSPRASPPV